MKPSVFIGSTTEGKIYAEAVAKGIASVGLCKPWYDGIFEVSGNTQESLVRSIRNSDFVVIVLTSDDLTKSRNRTYFTPRDNLLFEAGIGFGAIDPERTILIPEKKAKLKLPSDLAGFTLANGFSRDSEPDIGVAPAVEQIKEQIRKLARRPRVDVRGGKDTLAEAAVKLINAADRHVVLFGRDLSWADRYVDAIKARVREDVNVEVFCERPVKSGPKENARKLQAAGAKVHFCDSDPGLKLTMVDFHSASVARFMLSFKVRLPMGADENFEYRCEIHDAKGSPVLWRTLKRIYELLKISTEKKQGADNSRRRK